MCVRDSIGKGRYEKRYGKCGRLHNIHNEETEERYDGGGTGVLHSKDSVSKSRQNK